jgi:hypothetical protein
MTQGLDGPQTGNAADADPAHRHAVRVTQVAATEDPLGGQFEEPQHGGAVTDHSHGVSFDSNLTASAFPFLAKTHRRLLSQPCTKAVMIPVRIFDFGQFSHTSYRRNRGMLGSSAE